MKDLKLLNTENMVCLTAWELTKQTNKLKQMSLNLIKDIYPNDKYLYRLIKIEVSEIYPTQFDDDYLNSSSEFTAIQYINVLNGSQIKRIEDFYPIFVDSNYNILDGNHRHCAHHLCGMHFIYAWKRDEK